MKRTNDNYASFFKEIVDVGQESIFKVALSKVWTLPETINEEEVKQVFSEAYDDGRLSIIKDRVIAFIECIENYISNINEDSDIKSKLLNLKNNLEIAFKLINEVAQEKISKDTFKAPSSENTSLQSYEEKINELQGKLNSLENEISSQKDRVNDRMFTLLINTVAILGIFVAIVFAGTGSFTLISTIELSYESPISLNVFYFSLIGIFVYNLLLLLVYCIFKMCFTITKSNDDADKNFSKIIPMWFFLIVDLLMIVTAIASGMFYHVTL